MYEKSFLSTLSLLFFLLVLCPHSKTEAQLLNVKLGVKNVLEVPQESGSVQIGIMWIDADGGYHGDQIPERFSNSKAYRTLFNSQGPSGRPIYAIKDGSVIRQIENLTPQMDHYGQVVVLRDPVTRNTYYIGFTESYRAHMSVNDQPSPVSILSRKRRFNKVDFEGGNVVKIYDSGLYGPLTEEIQNRKSRVWLLNDGTYYDAVSNITQGRGDEGGLGRRYRIPRPTQEQRVRMQRLNRAMAANATALLCDKMLLRAN
jgi:hypothetical protein